MNNVQKEDIQDFASTFGLSAALDGSKFLVTGATGLIGSTLVNCLIALGRGIQITCPVRSIEKAQSIFGVLFSQIAFVECDLVTFLNTKIYDEHFDYIVHCASPTSGKFMTENPVETYMLAIDSTRAILEYARKKMVLGFVYVSSLEYYGQILDDSLVTEDRLGYIDNTDPRSSYPLGKRAAEYLCNAYAREYHISAKIARLTQTFGAGVSSSDNRVFAQFARSILTGDNIVLHTMGESAKPYCYTTDCVSAIMYILLRGEDGEAYNVANENTYISIRDMAEFLCSSFNSNCKVQVILRDDLGYAPVTKLNLCTNKLRGLGWQPKYGLKEMYERLLRSLNC